MPLHDKVVFELYKKPSSVQKAESYKPTQGMVTAAKRALRWKEEGKATGAGTPVGWGRATDIVAGRSMSLSVVTRMYSFFSRHEVDKKGKDFDNISDPSNGRIMWDAWGGDAGFTWSKAIVERAKKLEKHLAGQHDQSTHGKGGGGGKTKGKKLTAITRIPDEASQQYNMVSDSQPHIGLSPKAQEVASRIGPATRTENFADLRATAIYTDKDGNEYELQLDKHQEAYDESDEGRDAELSTVRGTVTYTPINQSMPSGSASYMSGEPNDTLVFDGAGYTRWLGMNKPFLPATIESLDVSPEYKGKGLATAMLEFARRESGNVAIFHSWNLTEEGESFARATKSVEKHLYGQHDQSTHAPHKRAGVPDGIDLDGKRFSTAARLELGKKLRDYDIAHDHARVTIGYAKVEQELGNGDPYHDKRLKESINDAYWARNPTPEQQQIKDIIQREIDSDPEVARTKAELEDNYLFKDAMAVRDANGIALGDKTRGEGFLSETPRAYLNRVLGNANEGNMPLEAYDKPTKFYSRDFSSDDFADVRTTPEESIKVATDDFLEFASEAEPVVFMPQDKLNQVLADGRVKTAHETRSSTAGQGTEEYIDHRLAYESIAYGYGNDIPIETRPVSGLLVGQGGYPSEAHSIYGGKRPAEIVLKPEVADRITWTEGDSLNTFRAGTAFDSTIFRPNHLAAEAAVYRKGTGKNYFKTKTFASQRPIEIQVHGGIKVSDIGKVRFYTPPSKAVAARLERQGIPYETVPLPEGN